MPDLKLRVTRSEAATALIKTITLESADQSALPGFTAGAHIRVTLPDGNDRPYSLVNTDPAPGATDAPLSYMLGVRLEEDSAGGSRYMHSLKAGDIITASEPVNQFELVDSNAATVLIAGGIGITPILSMAAALTSANRPFTFHYAGRSRAALALTEPLRALCGDALTIHCDDEPDTAIDLESLIGAVGSDSQIYVCGPRGMIESVRERAVERGFDREHVHFELFSKHDEQIEGGAFEVEISSTGQVFTIPPHQTIIEVLEAAGVDLIYDCQRGDCGICQTTVIEGIPDHRDVILTDEERAANNVMQICVSRARSERLVLDL